MLTIERWDKFIDFLPRLIPLVLIFLFLGWVAVGFLLDKLDTLFPGTTLFYGGMDFASLFKYFSSDYFFADFEQSLFWITVAFVFYFIEIYIRAQRNLVSPMSFKVFAKKVQKFGLIGSAIVVVGFILSSVAQNILFGYSPLGSGSDIFIISIFLLPAIPIIGSFFCFVYTCVRFAIRSLFES